MSEMMPGFGTAANNPMYMAREKSPPPSVPAIIPFMAVPISTSRMYATTAATHQPIRKANIASDPATPSRPAWERRRFEVLVYLDLILSAYGAMRESDSTSRMTLSVA